MKCILLYIGLLLSYGAHASGYTPDPLTTEARLRTAYVIDQLAAVSKTETLPWLTEYHLNRLLDAQEKKHSAGSDAAIAAIARGHNMIMPMPMALQPELAKAERSNRLTGRLCAYIERFMEVYSIPGMAVSFIDKERNIFINQRNVQVLLVKPTKILAAEEPQG
jgi:hypothetical protein